MLKRFLTTVRSLAHSIYRVLQRSTRSNLEGLIPTTSSEEREKVPQLLNVRATTWTRILILKVRPRTSGRSMRRTRSDLVLQEKRPLFVFRQGGTFGQRGTKGNPLGKFLKGSPLFRQMVATVVMLALLLPSLPSTTYAAVDVGIRQEINLIDGYFTATSGNFATTSAIINIDTNQYNDASYYFEAVASTTGAASRLLLRNATTFATVTSVDVSGTTAIRYRSGTAFTPTAGANDYVAVWENQSVGKSAQPIRVVILQNAASITDTETQIEMGSTASSSNKTTAALPNPMYFYYDENKWDGNITASAEGTYQLGPHLGSSTTYT